MNIHNSETFRKNIVEKIHLLIFDSSFAEKTDLNKKAINIEISIFNYAIKEAISKKIIKNWDNPQFIQLYKDRLRSIYLNLKKNKSFKEKIISEEITMDDLTKITHQEIFPEKWNDLINRKIKRDDSKFSQNIESMTDMYKCKKCGSKRSTYYELQTRSADESMTIFIRCIDCGNQMKR
jgi:DNA-directed RNA polymerase subunit M/transcription elongation factor TFIIS